MKKARSDPKITHCRHNVSLKTSSFGIRTMEKYFRGRKILLAQFGSHDLELGLGRREWVVALMTTTEKEVICLPHLPCQVGGLVKVEKSLRGFA